MTYPTKTAAFRYWLHLGCISFGGPAAQIALMHQALVVERRWISEQRFMHALNFCMLLPGPEAQQLAIYIGWLLHGVTGGVVAGVLFVLPAFCVLTGLSWVLMQYGHVTMVAAALTGIKPLAVAMVCMAAWRMGVRMLNNRWLWALAISALLAQTFHLPFPAILLTAALLGWAMQRFAGFRPSAHGAASTKADADSDYVIRDTTPLTAGDRVLHVIVICLLLGVGFWVLLGVLFGWHSVYTSLASFFTKAALLTFGGAYAVLPYVFDASVHQYHWLSPAQMLDGLALGETTPGPLVMIVTYIGFVAGWMQALGTEGGMLTPWWAGLTGALVATWFTFLPGFMMIFAGAPLIERSRQQPALQGALVAMGAAVVGVIASLGLWLAHLVCWPQAPDVWAGVSLLLALWLLKWQKIAVFWLVPLFAALGVLRYAVGM